MDPNTIGGTSTRRPESRPSGLTDNSLVPTRLAVCNGSYTRPIGLT